MKTKDTLCRKKDHKLRHYTVMVPLKAEYARTAMYRRN